MPPTGLPYIEPNIFVNGSRLEVVDTFVYLGSAPSRKGSLDVEVNYSIERVIETFRKLE